MILTRGLRVLSKRAAAALLVAAVGSGLATASPSTAPPFAKDDQRASEHLSETHHEIAKMKAHGLGVPSPAG
jgi:hypothetical protein